MRHGSLFSGIGGFDLAAEWMGWENVFHCEWNEFGQKLLKYYWPKAESFTDITKTDFTKYEGTIDVISGGFPCQPFSLAGKRKGTNDERYLWHEMLRAIQEIKPKFVIAENVFGITNIDGGLVFEQVCLDLETKGYEVQAFIIPAAAKNAPHRRDRCWFIAFKNTLHSGCVHGRNEQERAEIWEQRNTCTRSANRVYLSEGNATNTNSNGFQGKRKPTKLERRGFSFDNTQKNKSNWENFPTESPVCIGDDGIPTKLDGITFSQWRAESIKGYGNAIVPQVAFEIFKAIIKTAP